MNRRNCWLKHWEGSKSGCSGDGLGVGVIHSATPALERFQYKGSTKHIWADADGR